MLDQRSVRRIPPFAALILLTVFTLSLVGCESPTPTDHTTNNAPQESTESTKTVEKIDDRKPPMPPITETFEGEPQLSLFPRAGDFRPEESEERFPYWNTFIEHIIKTSGPANIERDESQRSWALRGIKTIDSVGFFSPLAVQPGSSYQLSLIIKTALVEGASAGIGVLEFSEFLWIGNQFTEAQVKEYGTASQEGLRLTGTRDWEEHSFTFTTGPQTQMIHLVFFREGEHDRNPVLFDDISITPL